MWHSWGSSTCHEQPPSLSKRYSRYTDGRCEKLACILCISPLQQHSKLKCTLHLMLNGNSYKAQLAEKKDDKLFVPFTIIVAKRNRYFCSSSNVLCGTDEETHSVLQQYMYHLQQYMSSPSFNNLPSKKQPINCHTHNHWCHCHAREKTSLLSDSSVQ